MSAESSNTARLEAFSDGVFAIAVTLLVFNLKVPEFAPETVTDAQLRAQLWRTWPAPVSFLLSFMTILIIWLNHHNLFKLVRRSDRTFMFTNGLLLLVVSYIPFPTSLLSAYILTDAAPTAAFLFSGTYFLLAVAFNLLWYVATRRGLLRADAQGQVNFRGVRRGYLIGPVFYGLATVLAWWLPLVSVGICLGMAVYYAVLNYEKPA